MNTGVIEGQRETDWIAGESSAMGYEVRNPSGDWTPYLPKNELQKNPLETMACVSFSFNNSLEMQHKLLMGFERNFSDRWLAKMSNTTINGNYLWAVADCARINGLVDEDVWPHVTGSWNEYYAPIPQDIKNRGKAFLHDFEIKYEWVDITPESLKYHLKHAPLQVILPNPGHAIVDIHNMTDIDVLYDTYEPFLKNTPHSQISSALKIVLTPKLMNQAKIVKSKKSPAVFVCYEMPDMAYLNKKASIEGFSVPTTIPDTDSL